MPTNDSNQSNASFSDKDEVSIKVYSVYTTEIEIPQISKKIKLILVMLMSGNDFLQKKFYPYLLFKVSYSNDTPPYLAPGCMFYVC